MKVKEISFQEFRDLSLRDESHFYEKKSKLIAPKKLQKYAVSFGNADGGELIVGIKDNSDEPNPEKRWDGFSSIEDLNGLLQTLFNISPSLDLKYTILTCPSFKGYVIQINIERTAELHKTLDGEVYLRSGAQSIHIKDPQKIVELSYSKGTTTFEDQTLPEIPPEQITDAEEIKLFLKSFSPKTDALDFCVNQNLFTYKEWFPRVAAVLLFLPSPASLLPKKCSVKITRYNTNEEKPEREHLLNQETIDAPLYNCIKVTAKRITEIISSVTVMIKNSLVKMDYPQEAIWEIIVNSLVHRDYSISDDVHVLIYNNRIEILSPGKLPGYVTTSNILDARYARNPKIVRTLHRYPDPPNKDMGEGLNTAFQKMKERGLQPPIITEVGNYVKVTLPHLPMATPAESILKYLNNNPEITNKEVRELTGIKSENLVKAEFYKLRKAGFLERVPEKNSNKSAWKLTEAGRIESQKYS
ncbi:transcriptional regulator [Leptospira biflexa serovar Patoc strain 'Patoc 1 (Ames)']|uniref:Putative ATP-binding protein n=1 Tax=Leptospira biflexa serovar Patoc (strain Patoc 1 / ATCC 23582 / Paris) TaxID=456481 RepID=B0ST81_LEPBP|nr:ATP-binding protein [Leptospira biflexa]ABZ94658.1 transcriptional regulator [Leptospira biflexa serovar Patoc strain 'Patoc 1 (Ames)']ABZ98321.1 Putative ATP-binding protein [Leptospira biflexa serovar Patoc strain 'Patoc 1 (Paris)']